MFKSSGKALLIRWHLDREVWRKQGKKAVLIGRKCIPAEGTARARSGSAWHFRGIARRPAAAPAGRSYGRVFLKHSVAKNHFSVLHNLSQTNYFIKKQFKCHSNICCYESFWTDVLPDPWPFSDQQRSGSHTAQHWDGAGRPGSELWISLRALPTTRRLQSERPLLLWTEMPFPHHHVCARSRPRTWTYSPFTENHSGGSPLSTSRSPILTWSQGSSSTPTKSNHFQWRCPFFPSSLHGIYLHYIMILGYKAYLSRKSVNS